MCLALGAVVKIDITSEWLNGAHSLLWNPGEETRGWGEGLDKMISQFGTNYNWHLSYPNVLTLLPLPHYILTLCQGFLLLNSSKLSGDSEYLPQHCHNAFIYCFPPKCKLRGQGGQLLPLQQDCWDSLITHIALLDSSQQLDRGWWGSTSQLQPFLLHCFSLFLPYSFNFNVLSQVATPPAGLHLYTACTVGFLKGIRGEHIVPICVFIFHSPALATFKCCGFRSPIPATLVYFPSGLCSSKTSCGWKNLAFPPPRVELSEQLTEGSAKLLSHKIMINWKKLSKITL